MKGELLTFLSPPNEFARYIRNDRKKISKIYSSSGINGANRKYFSLNIHDLQISNKLNSEFLQTFPRSTAVCLGQQSFLVCAPGQAQRSGFQVHCHNAGRCVG